MSSLEKELFFACLRGDLDGVKNFLDQGANMNVICVSGRTSFGAAAQLGHTEILQLFIDYSKNYDSVKLKDFSKSEPKFESKVKRPSGLKTKNKSNLGYFVCVHNEPGPLNSSDIQSNVEVEINYKMAMNEINNDENLIHSNLDSNDILMSTINNTAYDLATFNDSFVRRDPRFRAKKCISEVEATGGDGETTPEGMDKLEWDMEVEENYDLFPPEEEDSNCELYLWYTGVLLQTISILEEKPPPNDIDREDQFGCRALHYAAKEGHIDAVKLLINAGCKVNVGDSDNITPLHTAAANDNPKIIELLIEAGANIHSKTTDRISPLHVSASKGFLDNVKLLVEGGAYINTLDSSDRSPLFMAVSRSHQDVVAYLLEQGARVNLEEIHGYTPLYEAVWQKNLTIAKMLLGAGAKITQSHYLLHYAVLHRHKEMVYLLISAGSIINLRDENGDTPLIVAAKTHQTDVTRLLLMNGASINCKSYVTGNTPLHEIICNMSGDSHKFNEMFSILQEFNVNLEEESDAGYTALCLAILRGFDDAAATLIRHGADVNHSQIYFLNFLIQFLLRGNRFLSELFIYAGYRFRDIQLPFKPSSPLEQWIFNLKVNPLRLYDLCRIKVRAQFKSKVYEKVSALVLPTTVKRSLKLEDITKSK